MFRRGGVANEGIMTGLVDRSVSADPTSGGLNSLVRPGYQEGGDVDSGGYQFGETPVGKGIKSFVHRGIYDPIVAGFDMFGAVPLNTAGRMFGYNPGFSGTKFMDTLTGGAYSDYGNLDPDVAYFPPFIKTSAEEGWAHEKKEEDLEDDGPDLNQPKIVNPETGTPATSRADDITAIYEDLLPMLQGTLGADQSELGRQKYLELAKFGANLMAQPGGSLTRAIGKAAADPLAGMTRIAEQQRQSKRVPAELAMKIALRETEGGPLMKNARDLMRADSSLSLKEAMAKVMPSDVAGTSKLIIDHAVNKSKIPFNNAGAILTYKKQIEQIISSDAPELAGEFGTPMPKNPKDLGEEETGNYYVKNNGELVRWDGVKLLKIDDTGFTGKIKKRKKK